MPEYDVFRRQLAASGCDRCGLSQGRTNIVIDRGDPTSSVLIVGEAPGREEDLAGEPFVGRSGRLLDACLAELGFDTRRDALVANIVKCRPPANRPPRPEEASACLPYLKKQIDLMRPEIVVLLGATAVKHLLPRSFHSGISARVGRFFRMEDLPDPEWLILFHPAYILRDPRKRPLFKEHLSLLVDRWKALKAKGSVDVGQASC